MPVVVSKSENVLSLSMASPVTVLLPRPQLNTSTEAAPAELGNQSQNMTVNAALFSVGLYAPRAAHTLPLKNTPDAALNTGVALKVPLRVR